MYTWFDNQTKLQNIYIQNKMKKKTINNEKFTFLFCLWHVSV